MRVAGVLQEAGDDGELSVQFWRVDAASRRLDGRSGREQAEVLELVEVGVARFAGISMRGHCVSTPYVGAEIAIGA
jgi:hypothetical protein